jgi:hypothetical protein
MNKPAKVREAVVTGNQSRIEAFARAGGKAAARRREEFLRTAAIEDEMLAVKRIEEEESGKSPIQLRRRESGEDIVPVE